jgi:arsenate reductase
MLTADGAGRFRAFSAGSNPKGAVHPMALDVLESMGFPHEGLRSKSWTEFAGPEAPEIDFIITVCDSAAGESCPVWPGQPITAHWGIEDPAAVEGPRQRQAFIDALRYLRRRIELLGLLPLASLDSMAAKARLQAIGAEDGATPRALS